MQRIRLALDARRIFPGMSGLGYYALNLRRALVSDYSHIEKLITFALPSFLDNPSSIHVREKIYTTNLKVEDHFRGDIWKHLFMDSYVRKENVNVFHDPAFQLPLKMSCPKVVSIHDLAPFRFPGTNTLKYRLYWKMMTRLSVHRADAILAMSTFIRDEIIRFLDVPVQRIFVSYQPADDIFSPGVVEKSFLEKWGIETSYLLSYATFEPRKNLSRLLDAYIALIDSEKNTPVLVLAGKMGWKIKEVQHKIRKLQDRKKLIHTGYLSRIELVNLVRGAMAVIVPSLYEGFGRPVVEAMQSGTPVCCSNSSSLPEVGGDAVLYFNAEDIESIKNGLKTITFDDELKQKLKLKGIDRARKFNLKRLSMETEKAYLYALEKSI